MFAAMQWKFIKEPCSFNKKLCIELLKLNLLFDLQLTDQIWNDFEFWIILRYYRDLLCFYFIPNLCPSSKNFTTAYCHVVVSVKSFVDNQSVRIIHQQDRHTLTCLHSCLAIFLNILLWALSPGMWMRLWADLCGLIISREHVFQCLCQLGIQ